VTSVEQASKDASHLVFVIPHQFLEKTLKQIAAVARKDVVAISLIKVIEWNEVSWSLSEFSVWFTGDLV
jgi:glycerol-3-phosphate dehydrogenase